MTEQTLTIQEIRRILAGGKVVYVLWNSRCVRRAHRRGNPHYEVVSGFQLSPYDVVRRRVVNVNSRLGRKLLALEGIK